MQARLHHVYLTGGHSFPPLSLRHVLDWCTVAIVSAPSREYWQYMQPVVSARRDFTPRRSRRRVPRIPKIRVGGGQVCSEVYSKFSPERERERALIREFTVCLLWNLTSQSRRGQVSSNLKIVIFVLLYSGAFEIDCTSHNLCPVTRLSLFVDAGSPWTLISSLFSSSFSRISRTSGAGRLKISRDTFLLGHPVVITGCYLRNYFGGAPSKVRSRRENFHCEW